MNQSLIVHRRVFVAPETVSTAGCRAIRAAMDVGAADAADVLDAGFVRDEGARRALEIEVDAATLRQVEEQIENLRLPLERFFETTLGSREGAGLLRYTAGGFYGLHRDRGDVAEWPGAARRRIAVVLFLNTSRDADAAGEFTGGTLRIYPDEGAPLDVQPREGLVVAFPADLVHEVTPVREGVRDAVVDWFY